MENDNSAIGFIDELKEKYARDEIRMMKRILIEGVRKDRFQLDDLTLTAIALTTALKGLEMPLATGNYNNASIEKSVDDFLKILCYGIMRRD